MLILSVMVIICMFHLMNIKECLQTTCWPKSNYNTRKHMCSAPQHWGFLVSSSWTWIQKAVFFWSINFYWKILAIPLYTYFHVLLQLSNHLASERVKYTIFPPEHLVWSQHCEIKDVKTVIIGQDPYHGPGQAHGIFWTTMKTFVV